MSNSASNNNGGRRPGGQYTIDALTRIVSPDRVNITIKIGTSIRSDGLSTSMEKAIGVLCKALGLTRPQLKLLVEEDLDAEAIEIAVGDVVGFAGTLPETGLSWWRAHPVAGPRGRTASDSSDAANGPFRREDAIVRALEEVLWADPGLLVPRELGAIRELARRRIPLREPIPRDEGIDGLERRSCALRPYDINVRLAQGLSARIGASHQESALYMGSLPAIRDQLFYELGVAFSNIKFDSVPEMPEGAYAIVINGLPRANGVIPAEGSSSGTAWLAPLTGSLFSWGPGGDSDVDESQLVCGQLAACLREAAWEFADYAWVDQQLQTVADNGFAHSVSCARAHLTVERITAVCGELTREFVSMRDLPGILDRLSEAALILGKQADPAVLASHVRTRMGEYLATQHGSYEYAIDSTRLSRIHRKIAVLPLPLEAENAVRTAQTGSEASGGSTAGGVLLQAVARGLGGWSDFAFPVVLTAGDVRAQVRRAISAQFPRLAVLAHEELDAETVELQPIQPST